MSNSHLTEAERIKKAVERHQSGELPEAEALYREILQRNPSNLESLSGLGLIALRFNHLDTARRLISKALSLNPGIAKLHQDLGFVYAALRDHKKALNCYEQALRLEPANAKFKSLIDKTRSELRLVRDPDYALQSAHPWSDSDWIWREQNHNNTLFVLFSGLGVGNRPPTFIFSNFLRAYPQVDKLFVRDLDKNWYLKGLEEITNNVQETAGLLRKEIESYDQVVFIGCSAGATAAILYGEILQVDKVLAFAPQTVLSEAKEKDYKDLRWAQHMVTLRSRVEETRYLDLGNLNPFSANIDIHYSADFDIDAKHARRVHGNHIQYFPHADADGHFIALQLRDSGELTKIIDRELKNLPTGEGPEETIKKP